MAKTVSGCSTSLHCREESSDKCSLILKVVLRSFSKEEYTARDFNLITTHLTNIIDEPALWFTKNNDQASRNFLDACGYKYKLVTTEELQAFNKRSTIVVFIFKSPFFKSKKILEIICKQIFHYSILLI